MIAASLIMRDELLKGVSILDTVVLPIADEYTNRK
jgi:hypothetical protein